MLKTIHKRVKNERGLTLVELLAVIVILGIIAAIAVPAIGNLIDKSRYDAIKADGLNAISAASMYFMENEGSKDGEGNQTENVTISDLVSEGYLDDAGSLPNDGTVSKDGKLKTAKIEKGKVGVTFNSATKKNINAHKFDKSNKGNITIGTGA